MRRHLRAAGAVFVGKTNLHEYALGTTSGDSAFGAVRNPLELTRSPGGSSGGSAVSVATGMALATVGTDTGGSIRIPAAAAGSSGSSPRWARCRPKASSRCRRHSITSARSRRRWLTPGRCYGS